MMKASIVHCRNCTFQLVVLFLLLLLKGISLDELIQIM